MALEGTIRDFGLPDIFQLIGLQRKTGLLTLTNEKDDESVTVTFENGMVVMADSSARRLEDRLGNVLVKHLQCLHQRGDGGGGSSVCVCLPPTFRGWRARHRLLAHYQAPARQVANSESSGSKLPARFRRGRRLCCRPAAARSVRSFFYSVQAAGAAPYDPAILFRSAQLASSLIVLLTAGGAHYPPFCF